MKRLFIIILLSLWSCEPGHILDPPYQSEWMIVNGTNREIHFYWEGTYIDNDLMQERTFRYDYLLTKDDFFYQAFHGEDKAIEEFDRLFSVSSKEELKSSKFYFSLLGSDEILKEWVMGADNGEHDLFDESQWEHRSWESPQSYYTIYHNAWTFTLTEADIAVAE